MLIRLWQSVLRSVDVGDGGEERKKNKNPRMRLRPRLVSKSFEQMFERDATRPRESMLKEDDESGRRSASVVVVSAPCVS